MLDDLWNDEFFLSNVPGRLSLLFNALFICLPPKKLQSSDFHCSKWRFFFQNVCSFVRWQNLLRNTLFFTFYQSQMDLNLSTCAEKKDFFIYLLNEDKSWIVHIKIPWKNRFLLFWTKFLFNQSELLKKKKQNLWPSKIFKLWFGLVLANQPITMTNNQKETEENGQVRLDCKENFFP